jgi:hypothetical protein
MRPALLSLAILTLVTAGLPADEPGPIELVLRPRAIETPPLKYRLFPPEAELKPGNAATILLRLPWDQMPWMTEIYPKLHEWAARPLDAPEWENFNSGGVLPDVFFSEMRRAAFRREASWEYPLHEAPSPYLIRLPDVQVLRGFLISGLSARIRYHLSRGELDQAREGILVGLGNGRHLAQTPFLITQLVARQIHWTMLDRAGELISQPGSPNLYWALSTLPDTLLQLDRAASLEGDLFAMTFPAVYDLDRPRDAAEWSRMAAQLVAFLQSIGEIPPQEPPREDLSVVEQFLKRLKPAEKSHLAKVVRTARAELPQLLDIPAERVTAMSDDEAAVRWYASLRLTRDQQFAAVLSLPPGEAWPQLKQLQADITDMQAKTGTKGYDFLEPVSIYSSLWSLQRKINALRIIEAVRHHLATHDGRLPRTLDEMQAVPVPRDPLTGQPFEWSVDGATATLKAPPLPADVVEPDSALAKSHALEYRLQMK